MRAYKPLFVGFSILLSGCATVVHGRYQDLTINSNPPGATFDVDGITGTTPAMVQVRRKDKRHVVTISKPGYQTAKLFVSREVNPWMIGNLLFGLFGLPGFGVDLISGGGYELNQGTVAVNMLPDTQYADYAPAISPDSPPSRVVEAQHAEPPPKPSTGRE